MARTINEIYDEMLLEKSKYSSLNNLSNTSSTSIWRSIMYVVAVIIALHEQLLDAWKTEMTTYAESLAVGTKEWYAQQLLLYQDGYNLEYNNRTGKLEYPIIDESARILVAGICINEGNVAVLKTAKDNGSGSLTGLTETEHQSVIEYIDDFKFAGTYTRLYSYNGDDLKLSLDVKVNTSKININGQSVLNSEVYPIEEAITNFLTNSAKENFDSTFRLINLIDAIQQVDGVTNLNITLAQAKPDTEVNYVDILLTQFKTYTSLAGYLKIDSTHSLRDNITYIL